MNGRENEDHQEAQAWNHENNCAEAYDPRGDDDLEMCDHSNMEGECDVCDMIEEHGGPFEAWLDHHGESEAVDTFLEAFRGVWRDLADFAQEEAEALADIPTWLVCHVDWESVGNDLDVTELDAGILGVYIFDDV